MHSGSHISLPYTKPNRNVTKRNLKEQESCAVARKPRDAAADRFGLKFADNIHYKFKSSQASKARLQSSKHTGAKQNLTQNGHSGSLKVSCFGVSGKAIRD